MINKNKALKGLIVLMDIIETLKGIGLDPYRVVIRLTKEVASESFRSFFDAYEFTFSIKSIIRSSIY